MRTKLYILCFLCLGIAQAQTLEAYLTEAQNNSTAILAKQYQHQSALEKVTEVGSLPNTQLGAGYFIQPTETRVGPQTAKISASQQIPWFGILAAKKKNASLLANAKESEIHFLQRQLSLDVKLAYYELYTLLQKNKITKTHIEVLKTYEELALHELENNRSSMVDVLHIKMKRNTLVQQEQAFMETIQQKKTTFNLLLNRPITTEVLVLDSLLLDDDILLATHKNIANNPKLQQLNYMEDALQQSEIVAKKEGNPSLNVGLDYVFVDERNGINLTDNGKDIIMPSVKVSIPIFSKKYRSKQKQLHLERQAISQTKVTVTNQLRIAFEQALSKLRNAKLSIKTQQENIDQTKQAKEVILAAYQTAKMDFEQLLDLDLLKLNFELEEIEAVQQYLSNTAIIKFLSTQD